MKRAPLLATLLLLTASTQFAFANSRFPVSAPTKWSTIEEYVAGHATYVAPGALDALKFESTNGSQTWTIFGLDSKPSILAGAGIGWPQAGNVVLFASAEEATVCSNLILEVTYGEQ